MVDNKYVDTAPLKYIPSDYRIKNMSMQVHFNVGIIFKNGLN